MFCYVSRNRVCEEHWDAGIDGVHVLVEAIGRPVTASITPLECGCVEVCCKPECEQQMGQACFELPIGSARDHFGDEVPLPGGMRVVRLKMCRLGADSEGGG